MNLDEQGDALAAERHRREQEALAADVMARMRAEWHVEPEIPDEALEDTFAYRAMLLREQVRRLVDLVVGDVRRLARKVRR